MSNNTSNKDKGYTLLDYLSLTAIVILGVISLFLISSCSVSLSPDFIGKLHVACEKQTTDWDNFYGNEGIERTDSTYYFYPQGEYRTAVNGVIYLGFDVAGMSTKPDTEFMMETIGDTLLFYGTDLTTSPSTFKRIFYVEI